MKKRQNGFTLIEMVVVIAIIGILAATAFPVYTDYLVRSKVSEAVVMLAGMKYTTVEYYIDRGEWPPSANVLTNRLDGKYTENLITGGSHPVYYVEVTMRANTGEVSGKQIRLIYNVDEGAWTCTTEDTADPIPARFLPGSCR